MTPAEIEVAAREAYHSIPLGYDAHIHVPWSMTCENTKNKWRNEVRPEEEAWAMNQEKWRFQNDATSSGTNPVRVVGVRPHVSHPLDLPRKPQPPG